MATFEINLITYNPNMKYFKEAIDSLEAVSQVRGVTINIWDNGSESWSVKEATKDLIKKETVNYLRVDENDGKAQVVFGIFKNSKADYLIFMNDDDIISSKRLEYIIDKISKVKADIFILDYLYLNDKSKKEKVKKVIKGQSRAIENIPKYTWTIDLNCIYSTKFIRKNKIKFSEEVKFYEDIYNNVLFFSKTNDIYYVDEWFYKYRIKRVDKGNISSIQNVKKNIDNFITIVEELKTNEILYNKSNIKWRLSLMKWPIFLFGRRK